jgi:tRNA1(Val) A37 N6-methylase TrmN6
LQNVENDIYNDNKNLKIFGLHYFNPIFALSKEQDLEFFFASIINISKFISKLNIPPEYYFDYLTQKLISPLTRHKSGEYYTPPFLVKKMVKESYRFGETVLDPCCGSANFLIEIIKLIISQNNRIEQKLKAINNIYGFDVNPISIYMSRVNLILILKDFFSQINLNLYTFDTLFHTEKQFIEKYDLVIGNPPWYTYRNIESLKYQEKIKNLAEQLGVKPLPKNLLNLEISTLFFMKAKETFLKEEGRVFFVITKGVITGSHTSRFRNFRGFSEIKIWSFDKKIQRIFNIHFICLFGKKSKNAFKALNKDIKSEIYSIIDNKKDISYFDTLEMRLERTEILIPYIVEEKAGKIYSKKLISKNLKKTLLPIKESHYKALFHKGADLNPRNLIFITFDEINESLVRINPDGRIFKKAKYPWNKKEFKNELIEKKYIFKVVKSTELVKFYIYNDYNVFLPLTKKKLQFDYHTLEQYAKLFYDKINKLYLTYQKEPTKHKDLMDNLNRWSKLINKRQISKIKVVYNNSGSILQSAVIRGDYLITGDLSFYNTDNLNEAFYLSAILNSNVLTQQIKIMKSSRHIFKLPFDIPIKKYDVNNPNHQKLADLGEKGYFAAERSVNTYIKNNKENFTKFRIQNIVNKNLKLIIGQIDEILIKELPPS